MLKRNFAYKMLALAIAIVIWTYANEGQNPRITKEMKVPLDIRKIEPGLVVASAPKTVKITIEGARDYVERVVAEPDTLAAYVNGRGKAAGRHVLPVKVDLPEGLKFLVTAIPIPPEAAVTLDERSQRPLPIDVQFTNPPPVGYRFGAPQLSPNRAAVIGTTAQLDVVSQLVVAVDTRRSAAGEINSDFPIVALDKDGKPVAGVEINPRKVHLRLELLESAASRIVFVSPDVVGQPPFPYKVTKIVVIPQTVSVSGRPEQLADVTTLRTEPLQVGGRTDGFSERVRVIPPQGLALGESGYVRVTVTIASSEKNPPSEPGKGD